MADPRRYMRLAASIRAEIANGAYPADAPLPSTGKLRAAGGYSRQTAGKALRVLEGEKLIYRAPGLGYYVTDPEDPPIT
jgi:DNA-binding GntR family transcriptional regulator